MLNIEIWKEIPELPYDISSLGNVRRSLTAKYKYKNRTYVKPYINNKGYLCINLYKQCKVYKKQIHRLLAEIFIPNPNNLSDVNHIDGNPLNNALFNLEWCTHSENLKHAWRTGLRKTHNCCASIKRKGSTSQYRGVSWSNQRQRWCVYVTVDKKHYSIGRFKNEIDAAQAYDAFLKENNLVVKGYKLNFN